MWRRYQHSAWICFKLPSLISGEPPPAAQSLRGPRQEISISWATGNRDPAAPPTAHPRLDAERGLRLRARRPACLGNSISSPAHQHQHSGAVLSARDPPSENLGGPAHLAITCGFGGGPQAGRKHKTALKSLQPRSSGEPATRFSRDPPPPYQVRKPGATVGRGVGPQPRSCRFHYLPPKVSFRFSMLLWV